MNNNLPKKLSEAISHLSFDDQELIGRAYEYAQKMHKGQKRRSGGPYVQHPLRVAIRAAEDRYDTATIAGGLLHDVLEDTTATFDDLTKMFSIEIAQIVNGVTKISALRTKSKALSVSPEGMFLDEADNYRKILLAGMSDIRVMIIRIFDRLDNIATIKSIAEQKRQFYARETIEIYAPIAERLGMGVVKGDLEDLSFPYAYPEEYKKFSLLAHKAYKNPKKTISSTLPEITKLLKSNLINYYAVEGRTKRFFSLYKKMLRGKNLETIYDIVAVRVIVFNVADCYKILGLIHQTYRPVPGKIKDYIARPKENGYQSLHTTVSNADGNIFEIQIRTLEMHNIDEFGYAAHWDYKENIEVGTNKQTSKNRKEWLLELEKIQGTTNNQAFLDQLKENLFSNQIFVFTPKGKIIKLPKGACGLDFAYRIHSDLGNSCSGVKVDGKLVTLSTELKNGDTVLILSNKKVEPHDDWLSIAKTAYAHNHIKNYLRVKNLDRYAEMGEKTVDEFITANKLPPVDKQKANSLISLSKIPLLNLKSAFAAIAVGKLSPIRLVKVIYPRISFAKDKKKQLHKIVKPTVGSLKGVPHSFAGCCKPKEGDHDIIGYLGNDRTIKIHKQSCKRLQEVDSRRLIELS